MRDEELTRQGIGCLLADNAATVSARLELM